jgi:hypothetical protein
MGEGNAAAYRPESPLLLLLRAPFNVFGVAQS